MLFSRHKFSQNFHLWTYSLHLKFTIRHSVPIEYNGNINYSRHLKFTNHGISENIMLAKFTCFTVHLKKLGNH